MRDANRSLSVLLIRHAESVAPGISGLDEYTRPLTAKGMRDAQQLCDALASARIDAAYSSPYLRAHQTIEPIAQARGLSIETVDDLRERLLSPLDLPEWRAHLKRSWEDFDYAPPGGETSREAQARVVRVLDTLATRYTAGTVILASHGNLIALALNAFKPSVGYAFWESIPMPAVFKLIREGDDWTISPEG
ncbi:MAG TPA: histidine phosphatase family protein [Candidatus Binatus sp.]|uniref:histidine phosphatase family protein n=1 Tax=Candidatus Binatus sp. TaxID=2811406 RepID=UPI002F3FF573